jgi:hypothetical protein
MRPQEAEFEPTSPEVPKLTREGVFGGAILSPGSPCRMASAGERPTSRNEVRFLLQTGRPLASPPLGTEREGSGTRFAKIVSKRSRLHGNPDFPATNSAASPVRAATVAQLARTPTAAGSNLAPLLASSIPLPPLFHLRFPNLGWFGTVSLARMRGGVYRRFLRMSRVKSAKRPRFLTLPLGFSRESPWHLSL